MPFPPLDEATIAVVVCEVLIADVLPVIVSGEGDVALVLDDNSLVEG